LKLLKEEELPLNDFQNTFKNKVLDVLLSKERAVALRILPASMKVGKDIMGL